MPAEQTQIPEFLKCPITGELIREPVIARDGFTYEKEAWLSQFGWRKRRVDSVAFQKRIDSLEGAMMGDDDDIGSGKGMSAGNIAKIKVLSEASGKVGKLKKDDIRRNRLAENVTKWFKLGVPVDVILEEGLLCSLSDEPLSDTYITERGYSVSKLRISEDLEHADGNVIFHQGNEYWKDRFAEECLEHCKKEKVIAQADSKKMILQGVSGLKVASIVGDSDVGSHPKDNQEKILNVVFNNWQYQPHLIKSTDKQDVPDLSSGQKRKIAFYRFARRIPIVSWIAKWLKPKILRDIEAAFVRAYTFNRPGLESKYWEVATESKEVEVKEDSGDGVGFKKKADSKQVKEKRKLTIGIKNLFGKKKKKAEESDEEVEIVARVEEEISPKEQVRSAIDPYTNTNLIALFKLIEWGADINDQHEGATALEHAIINQNKSAIEVLVEKGAVVSPRALHAFVERYNDVELLKKMFNQAKDGLFQGVPAGHEYEGLTLLHRAVIAGHKETVQYLIERGAPVDAVTHCENMQKYLDKNALALAIDFNRSEMVVEPLVLWSGARKDARCCFQGEYYSPLQYAVIRGNGACVEKLIAAQFRADVFDSKKRSLSDLAAEYGYGGKLPTLVNDEAELPLKDETHFPEFTVYETRDKKRLTNKLRTLHAQMALQHTIIGSVDQSNAHMLDNIKTKIVSIPDQVTDDQILAFLRLLDVIDGLRGAKTIKTEPHREAVRDEAARRERARAFKSDLSSYQKMRNFLYCSKDLLFDDAGRQDRAGQVHNWQRRVNGYVDSRGGERFSKHLASIAGNLRSKRLVGTSLPTLLSRAATKFSQT